MFRYFWLCLTHYQPFLQQCELKSQWLGDFNSTKRVFNEERVGNKHVHFTTLIRTCTMFRVPLFCANIRKWIDICTHVWSIMCSSCSNNYNFWKLKFQILKFYFISKILKFRFRFIECWLRRSTIQLKNTVPVSWEKLNWKADICHKNCN